MKSHFSFLISPPFPPFTPIFSHFPPVGYDVPGDVPNLDLGIPTLALYPMTPTPFTFTAQCQPAASTPQQDEPRVIVTGRRTRLALTGTCAQILLGRGRRQCRPQPHRCGWRSVSISAHAPSVCLCEGGLG